MKRVIFYFDGFNFYNGLKDKSKIEPQWKGYYWLDFITFANQFLDKTSHDLICVKYFTAPPSRQDQKSRQSALFSANKLLNGNKFVVINGQYQSKNVECRATCKQIFQQQEEKRTDVSIAITMLMDCLNDLVDNIILITADSDQIPAIEAIKKQFPNKKIKVYFPPERSSTELLNLCKPIVYLGDNESKFINSVMPNTVTNSIKTYTRPINWK